MAELYACTLHAHHMTATPFRSPTNGAEAIISLPLSAIDGHA
jgi:hypothetical protein